MQSDQCMRCKHFLGRLTCLAYPTGIPEEILTGEVDHSEPQEGDHDIQFKEAK
jgi:hypothetical protein